MTAKESDPGTPQAEAEHLSYEGSRVPRFVIAIWLVFFLWGIYYLLRWIPESWKEWFSR